MSQVIYVKFSSLHTNALYLLDTDFDTDTDTDTDFSQTLTYYSTLHCFCKKSQ